jgi:hypothetical protein
VACQTGGAASTDFPHQLTRIVTMGTIAIGLRYNEHGGPI